MYLDIILFLLSIFNLILFILLQRKLNKVRTLINRNIEIVNDISMNLIKANTVDINELKEQLNKYNTFFRTLHLNNTSIKVRGTSPNDSYRYNSRRNS